MRGFLIDPIPLLAHLQGAPRPAEDALIRPVRISGQRADVYAHLSTPARTVTMFKAIRHESFEDACYVDARIDAPRDGAHDGATCDDGERGSFAIYRYPHALFGRGLLVGLDARGCDTTPIAELEALRMNVLIGAGRLTWSLATGVVLHDAHHREVWVRQNVWLR